VSCGTNKREIARNESASKGTGRGDTCKTGTDYCSGGYQARQVAKGDFFKLLYRCS